MEDNTEEKVEAEEATKINFIDPCKEMSSALFYLSSLDPYQKAITSVTLTFNDVSYGAFQNALEKLGSEFHGNKGISIKSNYESCCNFDKGTRDIIISREPNTDNEKIFISTIQQAHTLLGPK